MNCPDKRAALAFLRCLDPSPDALFTFQTFDDKGENQKLARIFHGALERHWAKLTRLNERGAGVFVAVNETDGKGRKKENVARCRAVWAEIDGAEPSTHIIDPSIEVITPNGCHLYWLVDGIRVIEGERINRVIADSYSAADDNACDCTRVLRIPGFYHCKRTPTLVRLGHRDSQPFSREAILAAFPLPPPPPKRPPAPPISTDRSSLYGQAAIDAECRKLAEAPQGDRNATLFSTTAALAGLVAGGEAEAGEVEAAIWGAVAKCGLDEERQKTENTYRRAWERGMSEPRRRPPKPDLRAVPDDPGDCPEDHPARADIDRLTEAEQQPSEWKNQIAWVKIPNSDSVKPAGSMGNLALFLVHDPPWRGCLAYDEFSHLVRWVKRPPALDGVEIAPPSGPLSDEQYTYVQHWFHKRYGFRVGRSDMSDALLLAAKQASFHPVREYLDGLKWDGVERLNMWMADYLGTENTILNQSIGRWWLISAVARIYKPGCAADHVLILEGKQGIGKSRAAHALGGDWYRSGFGDLGTKDAAQMLQGAWLIEIPELDAFRGRDATQIKQFITTRRDSYRAPYARHVQSYERQCVFLGTTNEGSYLRDATGGRRFWPVECGEIDVAGLADARDQLFAEAAAALNERDEKWWPHDPDLVAELTTVQEQRYSHDPWEDAIDGYFELQKKSGRLKERYTAAELLEDAIARPKERWQHYDKTRIAAAMAKLGWAKTVWREGSKVVRGYVRPGQTCREM